MNYFQYLEQRRDFERAARTAEMLNNAYIAVVTAISAYNEDSIQPPADLLELTATLSELQTAYENIAEENYCD